jgi:isoprenylcysteine carboxyl methyltransferase (ICMT) family protein YpbQ
MNPVMILFAVAAFLFRIGTLMVSIRHERALKRDGAVELGARNSALLAFVHLIYYIAAVVEGSLRAAPFDAISVAGLILYGFGVLSLLAVMRLLGRFWTVKLLIARDHQLVTHPLFRWVRHPNYFLNILPELIGLALVLHAFTTLVIGLLIYSAPLSIRIRQEETAMRKRFDAY